MFEKKFVLFLVFLLPVTSTFAQKQFQISSPDGSISVQVSVDKDIRYSVTVDGDQVVEPSEVALATSQRSEEHWEIASEGKSSHSGLLEPVVWQKSKTIDNTYQQLSIEFENGLFLKWRIFDSGLAWRWESEREEEFNVIDEKADFNFANGAKTWYPEEDGFYSHNERLYKDYALDSVSTDQLASLPVLSEVDGVKMLVTESSLFNYAGMWVRGNNKGGLSGVHPHYPKTTEVTSDRDERVRSREDYIATIQGNHAFPWRVLMVARDDNDLLTNQLVYKLAKPSTGDFSWVEPGKVAWDWWNANNVYEVDFEAGINTKTYKYYIDFASEYDLKYIILDEGWTDTEDLLKTNPDINIKELVRYADQKNVGLILWASWLTLRGQMKEALDQFEEWGIKGIKVDFMQRDDQQMVRYYEKVAQAAAKRELLVNFHGAYKPTGWLRTYPNVLTSEGVLGNEISKFADSVTPDHTTTIPFIRMAAGPMDFTPGGMRSAHKDNWSAVPTEPMTIGPRSNQLAMYVIYESPLQMLCDTPTHYYDEPEAMDFLEAVPVEWGKTVPLKSKVGDYVLMARQAPNGDWYIGGMTDYNARELSAELSFLEEGKNYEMHVWKDGINADRNAKDFKKETKAVTQDTEINVSMVRGGGWVARITNATKN